MLHHKKHGAVHKPSKNKKTDTASKMVEKENNIRWSHRWPFHIYEWPVETCGVENVKRRRKHCFNRSVEISCVRDGNWCMKRTHHAIHLCSTEWHVCWQLPRKCSTKEHICLSQMESIASHITASLTWATTKHRRKLTTGYAHTLKTS